MPDHRSLHAMNRFGLGRRGGEDLPTDPVAWLAAQLDGPDPALALPGKTTAQGLAMLRRDREGELPLRRSRPAFDEDSAGWMAHWLTTAQPFRERLVWFWANHFTVSLRAGGEMMALVAPFVRDAIRPYVTGRFADMLRAVMRHPAMLMYLAGDQSAGGNEALARVSLERHTVTQASGYTQRDVTEYARVLSGWSFELDGPTPGFSFRAGSHQPGAKTVLGRDWPEGEDGGLQLLGWLGTHPGSYRAVAFKLARHFVADDPPEACVDRIDAVLRYTGGDLRAAAMAVVALPEAWQPRMKSRAPWDYVVAVLRALEISDYPKAAFRAALAALGQDWLAAPSPGGWPDTADGWEAAGALSGRGDWIDRLAPLLAAVAPELIAHQALGGLVPAETMRDMRAAGSTRTALRLLLTSSAFLRR